MTINGGVNRYMVFKDPWNRSSMPISQSIQKCQCIVGQILTFIREKVKMLTFWRHIPWRKRSSGCGVHLMKFSTSFCTYKQSTLQLAYNFSVTGTNIMLNWFASVTASIDMMVEECRIEATSTWMSWVENDTDVTVNGELRRAEDQPPSKVQTNTLCPIRIHYIKNTFRHYSTKNMLLMKKSASPVA
jgi:hypothetical protein